MFRAQGNIFDEVVVKATDENLTSENWEYILVRHILLSPRMTTASSRISVSGCSVTFAGHGHMTEPILTFPHRMYATKLARPTLAHSKPSRP
jgi:hypothetical protein